MKIKTTMTERKHGLESLARNWGFVSDIDFQRKEIAHYEAMYKGPHKWKYFKGEWAGSVRKCKMCGKYEFRFNCFTGDQWRTKIDPSSPSQHEIEETFSSLDKMFYKTAWEFLVPLMRLNEGVEKDCEKENAITCAEALGNGV